MNLELWFALAATNFVVAVAPGQNVALVGNSSVRAGLFGGMAAVAGILLAELGWSVFAVSLVLRARDVSPALYTGLQIASAVSLLWIGQRMLCERDAGTVQDGGTRRRLGRTAVQGIWIGAANPLSLMFFLSLLPGFVPQRADIADPGVWAFCVSAVLFSTAAGLAPWLLASEALGRAGHARRLQIGSGCALILIAATVLWRVVA